jgi:methionine biosynthesis protein MetW
MSGAVPPRAGPVRVTVPPAAAKGLRPDLAVIADWIAPGAHVLDLGCGDGQLLDHLQRAKGCTGYGVEIDDAQVLACARRGVDVIQRDIEAGLDMFAASRFDVVVLSMAIQVTHRTERVLREMSRLGAEGIVSFPNFGHWSHAWSILRGRMPVSPTMPYAWYDTPNLHLSTPKDFEDLLDRLGLAITRRGFLADGKPVGALTGLRATQAIYRFRVRPASPAAGAAPRLPDR